MFWKESKGLKNIPGSGKLAVTAVLILLGISYIFGFLNIYLAYSPIDREPGMSITDIQIAFYGAREQTRLEKSIDGSMREYFADDNEYQTVKDWIHAGGNEKDFETVQSVFENSCVSCHSRDVQVADVVLETYEDVESYLVQDTGKPLSRLVSLSHTHLFGIVTVLFILSLIFSFTLFSEKVKMAVYAISYFAAIADVGVWWLAKLSPILAPLVILGGALLAVSFVLLIVLSLYDMWVRKKA